MLIWVRDVLECNGNLIDLKIGEMGDEIWLLFELDVLPLPDVATTDVHTVCMLIRRVGLGRFLVRWVGTRCECDVAG